MSPPWEPKRVFELRYRLGLTQEDFARQLGVTLVSVGRWENGKSKPTNLSVAALEKLEATERSDPLSGDVSKEPFDPILELHKAAEWDSNRIARIRARMRLTQNDFAEALGVSVDTIHKWENDMSFPRGLAFEAVKKLEASIPFDDGLPIIGLKKVSCRFKYVDSIPDLPPLSRGVHQKALIRKANRPRPFRARWERTNDSPLKFLVVVFPRAGQRATRGDYANVEHDSGRVYTQVELINKMRRTKEGDYWEYNRLFRSK